MMNEIQEFLCPESISKKYEDRDYGTLTKVTYFSKVAGCERKMNVVLPAGYETSGKSYPVLYVAHGFLGNEDTMLNEKGYNVVEIMTNLAAEGKAREMILVIPNIYVADDPKLAPGFTPESVQPYDNFKEELIEVLEPFMDQNYRTLKGRENRLLFGFSMGAKEMLYVGLMRPDLFAYIGAVSPAPGLLPGKDWAMEHKGLLKEEDFAVKKEENPLELVLICRGEKDSVVQKFPIHYHEVMEEKGFEHLWYIVPGGEHNDVTIRSGLYNFAIRLPKE